MTAIALYRDIGGLGAEARRIIRAHAWLIAVVLGYACIGLLVARGLGLEEGLSLSIYARGVIKPYSISLVLFLLGYVIYVMVFVRPAQLTRYLLRDFTARFLSFERLFQAGIVLALFPVFVSIFTSFKMMIPWINPYSWDETFMIWDRWLHAGWHPWELLQPLLGYPWITAAVNFLYHAWFFVLYGLIVWQAFTLRAPQLRLQFLISFVLSWVLLGSVAAAWLSSAGPCYYFLVTGLDDPFVPLMSYLEAANEVVPVWALGVQEMLWERYQTGSLEVGSGISAMPSMHVSSAFLFFLLGLRVHRLLAWGLGFFFFVTLIGSVHLGWHYAIDGYVSIVATWIVWRLVGRLLRAADPRQPLDGAVAKRAMG